MVAHGLATLVRIALAQDDPAAAARFAATADALLAEAGLKLLGPEGESFAAAKEQARELLGRLRMPRRSPRPKASRSRRRWALPLAK